jgi:hypothetical protein
MKQNKDKLLDELVALGCTTREIDGATLLALPEDDGEFIYERMGNWLYLGTTFMAAEELEDSAYTSRLDRFLLELQHRNLGCRFSYDQAGFLTIGSDLGPEQQQADKVMEILEHMLFVIESSILLCDQVLDSGEMPGDREVDEAFGLNDNLH